VNRFGSICFFGPLRKSHSSLVGFREYCIKIATVGWPSLILLVFYGFVAVSLSSSFFVALFLLVVFALVSALNGWQTHLNAFKTAETGNSVIAKKIMHLTLKVAKLIHVTLKGNVTLKVMHVTLKVVLLHANS